MTYKINDREVRFPTIVADITDECLVGADFLRTFRCLLDMSDDSVQLTLPDGSTTVLASCGVSSLDTCRRLVRTVRTSEVARVNGQAEVVFDLVTGPAHGNWRCQIAPVPLPRRYSVVPRRSARSSDLQVARSENKEGDEVVHIRLLNPTSKSFDLKSGTAIAECYVVPVQPEFVGAAPCTIERAGGFLQPPVRSVVPKEAGRLGQAEVTDLPLVLQQLVDGAPVENEEQRLKLKLILSENREAFSLNGEIGCTDKVLHRIPTGDAAPIRQKPHRLPLFAKGEADKCMKEMLDLDIIEPVGDEESEWVSPIVLVRKKDGSWRFCVDFRSLNRVTKRSSFPLPRIDDTLASMYGCSWFTSLDIKSAYWNIKVAPEDRNKTAFVVPGHGIHRFKRMPFGLKNAGASFQFLVEKALPVAKGGQLNAQNCCLAYLDDIIVPGRSVEENLEYVEIVLKALIKNKLKLHAKKCVLLARKLEYLGHVISGEGIATSDKKIAKIRDCPALGAKRTSELSWELLNTTPTTFKVSQIWLNRCIDSPRRKGRSSGRQRQKSHLKH